MNIGIDARIIYKRGVGRYISNLVKSLLLIDKKNRYYVYLDKNSVLTDYIDAKNCFLKRLNTGNAFIYEQIKLASAAKKDKVDVLHGTDNTIPYGRSSYKGKKTVTIHDAMFIRPIVKSIAKPTLKQRLTDIYNKAAIPASAKAADRIITVSDYSKQDIIKNIRIEPGKIEVIPEAVDDKYRIIKPGKKTEAVKQKFGITKPYIMMSAASDLRKNAERALEAFNIFNNMTEYRYQLVITSIGQKELATTKIMKKIKELNLEKYIVITGYVPDEEMAALYSAGFFLLFPSIWEGFGLQVLEAFACGLPVITSDNTSLKEVAGDAAYFIDPFSTEDIVKGMAALEKSSAKRNSLITKGVKQLEKYSWKNTAEKTLKVYERLFNENEKN